MMDKEIKAIPTYYKGNKFRSRLEAKWAVFFDSLNISWIYEPEGLNINGILYLPDFYLPDCNQFFECKGIMEDLDVKKINALISAGYSVTVGYDNGHFIACDLYGEDGNGKKSFNLALGSESWLCKCFACDKYWFMGSCGSWACQCCGEYDGDGHFTVVMDSYKNINGEWESYRNELWNIARQARFEHGETPQTNNTTYVNGIKYVNGIPF